ncbi:MAG: BrnT family toxin [Nitrospinae bacterium]|nr:BrnT family toxin [Nitrospinota bacterium]MCH7646732.1 BrnT family toxin [Nitrospinota bacterium]MCH7767340.1 BrnT family toxin [Nitrospinota bacterium]
MFIDYLEWDEAVVGKIIAEHQVDPEEVEEVIWDSDFLTRRVGKNRFMILGKTLSGRHLVIILDRLRKGDFKPVTAREMTSKEKKSFRRAR